jgi:hypothetical protein
VRHFQFTTFEAAVDGMSFSILWWFSSMIRFRFVETMILALHLRLAIVVSSFRWASFGRVSHFRTCDYAEQVRVCYIGAIIRFSFCPFWAFFSHSKCKTCATSKDRALYDSLAPEIRPI